MLFIGSLDAKPRFTYRQKHLAERIVAVAHAACDAADLVTALELLQVADQFLKTRLATGSGGRRAAVHIIEAHERIWLLRHPQF